MSDLAITDQPSSTRQAIEAKTRSLPHRVTGKLAEAIKRMVDHGERWDQAAEQVGLTVRTMRLALERPHVVAYLRKQKEVFREAASTANVKRLCEIRDAANNIPAVQAIKMLEEMPNDGETSGRRAMPGFVVQIVNNVAGQSTQTVDVRPMHDALPASQATENADE